jgi:putative transposase
MKDLYHIAGISKQAVWKSNVREAATLKIKEQVIDQIQKVRKDHKRMGCRHIYYAVRDKSLVGRDIFEQIGFAHGFRLKRIRNHVKTTWSQRVEVFPNLIDGLTINNINKVWQSDIFYVKVEQRDYYGICIEDIYSRKLLALHISKSLSANENIKALKQAFKTRKGQQLEDCIFHSDRGCQYISKVHKSLLRSKEMQLSMGKVPQENAYVERINGILKNDYLYERELTHANIKQQARKIMQLYNDHRPHSQLQMKTPTDFEKYIQMIGDNQRPKLRIHQWN